MPEISSTSGPSHGHWRRSDLAIWHTIPALVVELVSFFIVFIVSLLVAFNIFDIKPFQRGFFCDDQSLMYPYSEDTVSTKQAAALAIAILPIVALIVESIYINTRMRNLSIEKKTIYKTIGKSLYCLIIIYVLGGALTQTVVAMVKLTAGRLRPNFFAWCIPEYNTTLCSVGGGYVHDFVCTNNDTDGAENSMQSFPSGHASSSVYAFTYVAIYLDIRLRQQLKWRLYFRVVGPTLETLMVMVAIYIGVSRIQDYKHHPTDVLGGAVVGLVFSLVTSLLWSRNALQDINAEMPAEPSSNGSFKTRPDGGSQIPIIQSTYSVSTIGQDNPQFSQFSLGEP